MSVKLLTEHHLEFLSLKGGYTGSSESTLVKMAHCSKSHVAAHFCYVPLFIKSKCSHHIVHYMYTIVDSIYAHVHVMHVRFFFFFFRVKDRDHFERNWSCGTV